ncbi:hypothetical protein, partial [Pseudomonas syringae]|uniref:hypothetical protein n=1 Tax=Pseudomonas syringae TaxID=317 RepID=UPI001C7E8B66
GMLFVTLCVMDLRHAAYSGSDAERPERHTHAEHGYDGVLESTYRSSRSSVGMLFVTLCVMDLRHAAYSGSDAERPERHTHAEHGYDGVLESTYRSPTQSIGTMIVRPSAVINGTGQPRDAVL